VVIFVSIQSHSSLLNRETRSLLLQESHQKCCKDAVVSRCYSVVICSEVSLQKN